MSPAADDVDSRAIAAMNEAAARDPRLDAIIMPTRDGRDGVLLAVVRAEPTPLAPGRDTPSAR